MPAYTYPCLPLRKESEFYSGETPLAFQYRETGSNCGYRWYTPPVDVIGDHPARAVCPTLYRVEVCVG